MDQKIIKQALSEAEKEAQQEKIDRVKEIVKAHLEKIENCKDRESAIREERKIYENDLEDIKQGRLDKIMERQSKSEKARNISIIIVRPVEINYMPLYPWRSQWIIDWNCPMNNAGAFRLLSTDCCNTALVQSDLNKHFCVNDGTSFQNFSGGTYDVNNRIINL